MNRIIFWIFLVLSCVFMSGLAYCGYQAITESLTWLYVALGMTPSTILCISIASVAWNYRKNS